MQYTFPSKSIPVHFQCDPFALLPPSPALSVQLQRSTTHPSDEIPRRLVRHLKLGQSQLPLRLPVTCHQRNAANYMSRLLR